jgi:hypothetical protein
MTSDFESKIVSVERVKEYAEMPTEVAIDLSVIPFLHNAVVYQSRHQQ